MYKLFFVLLLLFGQYGNAQTIDQSASQYVNGKYQNKVRDAKVLVAQFLEGHSVPGFSITIANQDEIIWSEGIGYADLEHNVPVQINSKFRIGSISKSITTVALGKLIEQGKLELSDTIRKYVPYFPKKEYPITIKELATHTAGIRHYQNDEYMNDRFYDTIEESVGIFKDDTLRFKPGSDFGYSTYGFVLLSAVMEQAANQEFLELMNTSMFEPLNMTNTVPDSNKNIVKNRVAFYQESDNTIVNAPNVDNSNKWAGGGYLSTTYDLAKMSQALLGDRYLKESTLELLWTPTRLSNGEMTNYCLGWRKDKDDSGRYYIHHGGSSVGGRAFLLIYPEEEIIVAMTSNIYARYGGKLALGIAEIFMGI